MGEYVSHAKSRKLTGQRIWKRWRAANRRLERAFRRAAATPALERSNAMAGETRRVILPGGLLPAQYMEGEERSAFFGIAHGDQYGETSHNHVAVLTVRNGLAVSIEYHHSMAEAEHAAKYLTDTDYGMYSDAGNQRVRLLICCAKEGMEQGRERILLTAMVRDTITAIAQSHAEVTDTAVHECIYAALAPTFQQVYGELLDGDDIQPRRTTSKGGE